MSEEDALQRAWRFLQLQHRGNTVHSQFMKPSCQQIPAQSGKHNGGINSLGGEKLDIWANSEDSMDLDPDTFRKEIRRSANPISSFAAQSNIASHEIPKADHSCQHSYKGLKAEANNTVSLEDGIRYQNGGVVDGCNSSPYRDSDQRETSGSLRRGSTTSAQMQNLSKGDRYCGFGEISLFVSCKLYLSFVLI